MCDPADAGGFKHQHPLEPAAGDHQLGDTSRRLCSPWHTVQIMDQLPSFTEIHTKHKEAFFGLSFLRHDLWLKFRPRNISKRQVSAQNEILTCMLFIRATKQVAKGS